MNIKTLAFAFILVFVTSGCAGTVEMDGQTTVQEADTAQSTEVPQAAASDSDDPDERRCKRISKTGTRFKTWVCATEEEWDSSGRRGRETTKDIQARPVYTND